MFIKKSLAHGQVPTKFSLARLEKQLAPGVGQWDLSGPAYPIFYETVTRINHTYFLFGLMDKCFGASRPFLFLNRFLSFILYECVV
jgi:hypothetical protein